MKNRNLAIGLAAIWLTFLGTAGAVTILSVAGSNGSQPEGGAITNGTLANLYADLASVGAVLGASTGTPTGSGSVVLSTGPVLSAPTYSAQAISYGTLLQPDCHFKYDFSVDGGAVGTIIPVNTCSIPINSVIRGCSLDATTAATTSASGTLSVGVSGTGGGVAILLAATAAASVTGVLQCVILPQTASGWKKLTTAGQAEVAIATGALTAGVLEGHIFYDTMNN